MFKLNKEVKDYLENIGIDTELYLKQFDFLNVHKMKVNKLIKFIERIGKDVELPQLNNENINIGQFYIYLLDFNIDIYNCLNNDKHFDKWCKKNGYSKKYTDENSQEVWKFYQKDKENGYLNCPPYLNIWHWLMKNDFKEDISNNKNVSYIDFKGINGIKLSNDDEWFITMKKFFKICYQDSEAYNKENDTLSVIF